MLVLLFVWPFALLIWATVSANLLKDNFPDVYLIKNNNFNINAGIVFTSGVIYFVVIFIAWSSGPSFDARGTLLLFPRRLETCLAKWEMDTIGRQPDSNRGPNSALVKADTIGTWAPAETEQQVPSTRPKKNFTL